MPQASEAMRRKWGGAGGVGDDKAVAYLEQQGWHLSHDWLWYRDDGRVDTTLLEWNAMQFLICEWDYGGVRDGR